MHRFSKFQDHRCYNRGRMKMVNQEAGELLLNFKLSKK